jgi:alpha-tubulin suppressor-like RCC1 family protein
MKPLDGIVRNSNPIQQKKKHSFQKKKIFSHIFFFPFGKKKIFSFVFASFFLSFFFFQFFSSQSSFGATYQWNQTSWDTQSATLYNHPDSGNWSEYQSKDAGIYAGDSLQLTTYDASVLRTSDTDFETGEFAGTGITGSGEDASVGLLSALGSVAQVEASYYVSCALKTDETVWCWGRNNYGGLGIGNTDKEYAPVQVLGEGGVGYLTEVSNISVGDYHTCATKTDGTAWCWGRNDDGQLGDNTTTDRFTPVQVHGVDDVGHFAEVSSISVGRSHTCATKTDGTAWCWGDGYGKLGDNTTTDRPTPIQVHGVDDVGFLTEVSSISAGHYHTCATKTDGTAYCWGSNNNGKLGDNTTTNRYTPIQVHGVDDVGFLTEVLNISAGNVHTCATKTDGTAYCWGDNNYGQLGDNTTTNRYTPIQVHGVDDVGFLTEVSSISAGTGYSGHTCATKTDGTAWCWGDNGYGQLGDNTTTDRSTPIQVHGVDDVGFLTEVSSISAGYAHTCSSINDGNIYCWGSNDGALGDHTETGRETPIKVRETPTFLGDMDDVVQEVPGTSHSCVLKTDGTVWCWGRNSRGQLGDNTTNDSYVPIQVHGVDDVGFLTEVSSISAGNYHTCATKTDGTAWCWGDNYSGQLGDNTTTDRHTPTQVLGEGGIGFLGEIEQISTNSHYSHTCALKTDGTAWCWGDNGYGQLGDNTTNDSYTPVQVLGVGGSGYFVQVEEIQVTHLTTCALKTDGTAYCWGSNGSGQLGNDSTSSSSTPVQVKNSGSFSDFLLNIQNINSSGDENTCTTKTDGTVWCWGENTNGQLGDGTTSPKPGAVQVKGEGGIGYLDSVSSVETSEFFSCALKTDGTVWCWGDNNYGQLGDNTTNDSYAPIQVHGVDDIGYLTDVSEISVGRIYVCATKTDGTMYCWGDNNYGQLGDNTTTRRYTPIQVHSVDDSGFLTDVENISAGYDYTCATKTDGTAYCWGRNNNGKLGDNTTTDRSTPVQVLGVGGSGYLSGIVNISTGMHYASHTCATRTDGTAYCWGENQYGKLGDNTTTDRYTPVQVHGVDDVGHLSDVSSISTGYAHTCATKTDDTAYCWGWSGNSGGGSLGDGTTTDRYTPVQVHGVDDVGYLTGVEDIALGREYTCALKTDGTAYCWGYNTIGQLGTNVPSGPIPTQKVKTYIPASGLFANGAHLSGGSESFCATKTDGTAYCWGRNSSGKLGDNTTTNRFTPVQVHDVDDVGFLSDVENISAGGSHTCATKTDGTAYCWGDNKNGKLGDNTTTDRFTPVQVHDVDDVGFLTEVSSISAGDFHTCTTRTDGTAYCWGNNGHGQLGNKSYEDNSTPVSVENWDIPEEFFYLGDIATDLTGTFTSEVIDLGQGVVFDTLEYSGALNDQIITLDLGGGNTNTPDGNWEWLTNLSNGADVSSLVGYRYVQYRAHLTSDTLRVTPFLDSATLNYDIYHSSQSLVSSPFDSTDSGNVLGAISWQEDEVRPTGANVILSLRSAPDQGSLTSASWSDLSLATSGCDKDGSSVTCSIGALPASLKDTVDDQFFQYKFTLESEGAYTPTVDAVDISYVVNAFPDVQNVVATPNADQTVSITYEARDPDTETATYTPGYVTPSFEYWDGDSWENIASDALQTSDLENKAVQEEVFTTHTATWTPRTTNNNIYLGGTAKVRVSVSDNEGANNVDTEESNSFTLDTKIPNTLSLVVDASQDPAYLTIGASDDSSIQMKVSLLSDLSDASWENFSGNSTLELLEDPETVYVQFKDSYGNTTSVISTTTPETPTQVMTQDTSNMLVVPPEYRAFIGFKKIDEPPLGFASYKLYRSEDEEAFTLKNTVTNRDTNFSTDSTVVGDILYYYKLTTTDSSGNVSFFSDAVTLKANGVQDAGEGGGGEDGTKPTISNVSIEESQTTSVTLTWETDELSTSTVEYSQTPGVFTTQTGVSTYADSEGNSGLHRVTINNLTPNTTYYAKVSSTDPTGNTGVDDNGGNGYAFSTLPGPAIDSVAVSSSSNTQATIVWNTNVLSNSIVHYSEAKEDQALIDPVTITGSSVLTRNHSVTLDALEEGTVYYFQVTSTDGEGNTANDTNGGNYFQFATTLDEVAPTIENIQTQIQNNDKVLITFETDESASTKITFSEENTIKEESTEFTTRYNESHYTILQELSPDTNYIFTVTAKDINGNEARSDEYSVATQKDSEFLHDPLSEITDISDPPSILTDQKAVITFLTDQEAKCAIEYGTESGNYAEVPISESTYNQEHSMHISGLIFNTQYFYKILCEDNIETVISSSEYDFTTKLKQVDSGSETVESVPPEISSVKVEDVTGESAVVRWETDEVSSSSVRYGSTEDMLEGSINSEINSSPANFTTSHSVTLRGLIPSTKYYFSILSSDTAGNIGTSSQQDFTTDSPSSISSINTTSDTLGEATITWNTSQDTTSIVEYGETQQYGQIQENETQTQNHSLTISNLQEDTTYHFRVKGEDENGNLYASSDSTFTPKSPPNIQQTQIEVQSEREAKVTIITDVSTDATITYQNVADEEDAQTQGDPIFSQTHTIVLKDLTPGATYQATIQTRDEQGNATLQEGELFTMQEDTTPPEVDRVRSESALAQNGKVQVIMTWNTEELATSELIYKEGRSGEERTLQITQNPTNNHVAVLTTLKAGTIYSYKVTTKDLSGNTYTTDEYLMLTPQQQENVVELIIKNFKDIFSWAG